MSNKGILTAIALIFLLAGCSGGGGNPAAPDTPGDGVVAPKAPQGLSERVLWGVWGFEFDKTSGEIIAVPKRDIAVHYDITQMVISPACQFCFAMTVLEFKPVEKYVKIRIGLWNKTQFTGYDVRGFVISNAEGLKLRNPDGYMKIWDDGGAIEVNPFLAFGKDELSREFAPEVMSIREFELDFDSVEDLAQTTLVVDASYPGHCREPFAIFGNYAEVMPEEGGSAFVQVYVFDWQQNAVQVYIDADSIGGGKDWLTKDEDDFSWSGTIDTTAINEPGWYELPIVAKSANAKWAMWDYLRIMVFESPCQPGGDDTWEEAENIGFDQSVWGWVCADDISDWYTFDAEDHLAGVLKLDLIDPAEPALLELYDDPESDPLASVQATYLEDGIIDFFSIDAGPGTYYIRVGYAGNQPKSRRYNLLNGAHEVACFPDGNDSYFNAFEISTAQGSGTQMICDLDPEDWFLYDLAPGFGPLIETEVIGGSSDLMMTLYDEFQAWDPEGPNLGSVQISTKGSIDLQGHAPGKYYARVKQVVVSEEPSEFTLGVVYGIFRWSRTEWDADNPTGLVAGSFGDIHIAGYSSGTFDLDIGPGQDMKGGMGLADSFLTTADITGKHVWSVDWGGGLNDYSYDMVRDSSGNFYIAGSFVGLADFDPGPGIYNVSASWSHAYLLKLDSFGGFVWVRVWGAPDNPGSCQAFGLDVNDSGDVYITGDHVGDTDFDPGAGVESHSSSGRDVYVSKFDTDGNFAWVRLLSSPGDNSVSDIVSTDAGELYLGGHFTSDTDFDPGVGEDIHVPSGPSDLYIIKLDGAGDYVWGRSFGGTLDESILDLAFDTSGNLLIAGKFSSTVDFDPGPGVDEFTAFGAGGASDAYLSSIDPAGDYIGVVAFGSNANDSVEAIGVAPDGTVYLSGIFSGIVDFDPGPGVNDLASGSPNDVYLLRLISDWSFDSVFAFGGASIDYPVGLLTDGSGTVYILGVIGGYADMDPGPGELMADGPSPFLSKFSFMN